MVYGNRIKLKCEIVNKVFVAQCQSSYRRPMTLAFRVFNRCIVYDIGSVYRTYQNLFTRSLKLFLFDNTTLGNQSFTNSRLFADFFRYARLITTKLSESTWQTFVFAFPPLVRVCLFSFVKKNFHVIT